MSKKTVGIRLPEKTIQMLDRFCDVTEDKKSDIVAVAIEDFISKKFAERFGKIANITFLHKEV